MDDALLGIVLDRLGRQALADEPTDLLLAALEGEDALAGRLSAAPGEPTYPPGTTGATPDPVDAHLKLRYRQGLPRHRPGGHADGQAGAGLTSH